jgi:hypothetical protein
MIEQPLLYGVMAEFDSADKLLRAAREAQANGYRRMDAYTPFYVEGLSHALGQPGTRLPWLALVAGMIGAATGYLLQVYGNAVDYPYNAGGRPLHSWPAFIPVTFELTILFAALATVLGMLALNGLPRPYHPVFNAPRFAMASRNRFFLCLESSDPKFDRHSSRRFLESLNANDVVEVSE